LERKAIKWVMLTLFLTLTLSTVPLTPATVAYPSEDIFEEDLLEIANSVPQIESIYIKSWLDFRPSGHLWSFIRINYTSGLSDDEKIAIQYDVQHQLESKWYIDIVEPNYIFTIPEEPVPWPGFVIGDLNVAFAIFGDVNGDGEVNTLDVKRVKLAYSGLILPPDPDWYRAAALSEPEDILNVLDVKKMKMIYSGII